MVLECPQCHSRYDVGGRPVGTRVRCRCGRVFAVEKASESADVLKCPQCGAACRPDASTCAYCQAVLAVVACPRCFGRVFRGTGYCQHCGTSVGAPATKADSVTPRTCPRCAAQPPPHLLAHVVDGTLLDECHGCGGVWIDAAAFASVVKDRERQAALADVAVASTPESVPSPDLQVRYIRCPDCGQLMNRQNFGKRSGVIVDVCKAHGVWFDRDELSAVIKFVMKGGLLETKRRELEELQHEVERQKQQLTAGMAMPGNPMEHWVDRWRSPGLLGVLFDLFD
jgi:Zn-finger nucleic acid-binding protein